MAHILSSRVVAGKSATVSEVLIHECYFLPMFYVRKTFYHRVKKTRESYLKERVSSLLCGFTLLAQNSALSSQTLVVIELNQFGNQHEHANRAIGTIAIEAIATVYELFPAKYHTDS